MQEIPAIIIIIIITTDWTELFLSFYGQKWWKRLIWRLKTTTSSFRQTKKKMNVPLVILSPTINQPCRTSLFIRPSFSWLNATLRLRRFMLLFSAALTVYVSERRSRVPACSLSRRGNREFLMQKKQKKQRLLLGQRVHCSRVLQQRWRRLTEPTKECKCCFRWWWVAFEAEGDKRTETLHSTWWWGPPDPQASSSLMTEQGHIAPPCNPGSLWHECFPCAKITVI